ncbi:MAG: uracil-DNA glycosylase [Candidatus Marinimicrobia bacterium]|jgi:uracil-DNA glycosylase family 4|nr:uracil-DNA glycosylase [Candidatus Neomarinimicrobiota bacterium]MBT6796288.1 uracil-DNA glycosylase [Candidatus Neomarinimicrobiota bacterium]MBT7945740.1 uracil-DNA glycosylase [Candidatus Neomarinimicrobiota bacterium]
MKDTIHKYFKQQQLLYGNELYFSINPEQSSESILKNDRINTQQELDTFNESICLCMECPLGKTRTNFVFGVGDPNAELLLVGEAPGEPEDLSGEPIVGGAGKMLDRILIAIGKKRGDGVYIANVIKCRPPNNRDPLPSEVDKCEPYLLEQIAKIRPKLIVALGRVAGKTLLKLDVPLQEMREKTHDYNGTPLRVTYHPAALLRNSNFKKPCWKDFQWIQGFLGNA